MVSDSFNCASRQIDYFYIKFRDLKFVYSEKATKIFTLLLTAVHTVKSKGKISQNFVAFSEYMNFTIRDFKIQKIWFSE